MHCGLKQVSGYNPQVLSRYMLVRGNFHYFQVKYRVWQNSLRDSETRDGEKGKPQKEMS